MAAVQREVLTVLTLEGGVLTIEVMPTNTIVELKAMLREKKHCEDRIDNKILKVKVLANGLLVDDGQTLESAGLLNAESEVTVIYSRNEVEAETQESIAAEGLLQVNIPSYLTEIPAGAFEDYDQVVKHGSFGVCGRPLGKGTFPGLTSLKAISHSVTDHDFQLLASPWQASQSQSPRVCVQLGQSGLVLQVVHFLKNIAIPEPVVSMGQRTFADCASLKSITIPTFSSMTSPDYQGLSFPEKWPKILNIGLGENLREGD